MAEIRDAFQEIRASPLRFVLLTVTMFLGVGFSVMLMAVAEGIREAVLDSISASPVRAAAPALEAAVREKLDFLVRLIVAVSLGQTALAVGALAWIGIRPRRNELAQALVNGRRPGLISFALAMEVAIPAIIGGLFGYSAGSVAADWVGQQIGVASLRPLTLFLPFPVGTVLGVSVTVVLSWWILRQDPNRSLTGA